MTTTTRLAEAEARREEVRRELDGLANAKSDSGNAALAELESALMSELNAIEQKISQISQYLTRQQSTES